MRNAFIRELCIAAEEDERIWLLTGDLGYGCLEQFADLFPKRYLNVGIAEQNMVGVSAGLALSGKVVFTYSIANFPTMRCFEQIRNDVCYHNLCVKTVAVGGGLTYGSHGYSHHGVEDLAVTRILPNMTVLAPGDPAEAAAATRALAKLPGPGYLRLGKAGEPSVHQGEIEFRIGEPTQIGGDSPTLLISTGGMLPIVAQAAQQLLKAGVNTTVLSWHTIAPLQPDEAYRRWLQNAKAVVLIEEHAQGGLADVLMTLLFRLRLFPQCSVIRIPREPLKTAGTQNEMRATLGLSVEAIIERVLSLMTVVR